MADAEQYDHIFDVYRPAGEQTVVIVKMEEQRVHLLVVVDKAQRSFSAGVIRMSGRWDDNGMMEGATDGNVPELLLSTVTKTVRAIVGFEEFEFTIKAQPRGQA